MSNNNIRRKKNTFFKNLVLKLNIGYQKNLRCYQYQDFISLCSLCVCLHHFEMCIMYFKRICKTILCNKQQQRLPELRGRGRNDFNGNSAIVRENNKSTLIFLDECPSLTCMWNDLLKRRPSSTNRSLPIKLDFTKENGTKIVENFDGVLN